MDFEVITDHLLSARRLDLELKKQNKRTCRLVYFVVPAEHRVKIKESENVDKYLELARERTKLRNLRETVISNEFNSLRTTPKVWKGDCIRKKIRHHLNDSIFEIGQNTQKSLGELGILAVTLTLDIKNKLQELNDNDNENVKIIKEKTDGLTT